MPLEKFPIIGGRETAPKKPPATPQPPLQRFPLQPLTEPVGPVPFAGPPPNTKHLRDEARAEQLESIFEFALIYTGVGVFAGQVLRPRAPVTAGKVAEYGGALELPHPATPSRAMPRPGKASFAAFLPQPFGLMPQEFYGLNPNYLYKRPEEIEDANLRFLLKQTGAIPGNARRNYYAAKAADEAARIEFALGQSGSLETLRGEEARLLAPGFQEAHPFVRAGELLRIIEEELIRRGQTPARYGPLLPLAPPTQGTFAPGELDQPGAKPKDAAGNTDRVDSQGRLPLRDP